MRVEQSEALDRQILHVERIKETKWGERERERGRGSVFLWGWEESLPPLPLLQTRLQIRTFFYSICRDSFIVLSFGMKEERSQVYLTDQKLHQWRTTQRCTYCTAALRASRSVTCLQENTIYNFTLKHRKKKKHTHGTLTSWYCCCYPTI